MKSVLLLITCTALLAAAGSALAQEPAPPQAPPQAIAFDFQDVDIRYVLTALAEAANANLVFSQLPQKLVTLRTNRPLTRAEVLPLLESIVTANGLTLRADGPVLIVEAFQVAADAMPADASQARLRVYRVKHARAEQLASTLLALVSGGTPANTAAARVGFDRDVRTMQVPPFRPEAVAAASLDQALTAARTLPAQFQANVHIVADEMSNSLLIRSTDLDWHVLETALQALDIRPLQVLVEVMIAEVRRTSDFNLGISIDAPPQRVRRGNTEISGALIGSSTGDFVLEVLRVGAVSADVLIAAVSSKADVSILSRPVVLAQNNQEARILVGSERPFIQVFRALPTDDAVRDQVVQYRDVGTALTIRPTINDDGYVSLDLLQEVSFATAETQFGAPVISTREAATQLLVKDGHTVVIGGLMDRQQDRTRSGIPLLKDLPLIGGLFGSTHRLNINTELFLFITPHVIRTDEDAQELREGIEGSAELLRKSLPRPRTLIPADTLRHH